MHEVREMQAGKCSARKPLHTGYEANNTKCLEQNCGRDMNLRQKHMENELRNSFARTLRRFWGTKTETLTWTG